MIILRQKEFIFKEVFNELFNRENADTLEKKYYIHSKDDGYRDMWDYAGRQNMYKDKNYERVVSKARKIDNLKKDIEYLESCIESCKHTMDFEMRGQHYNKAKLHFDRNNKELQEKRKLLKKLKNG